jgi:hypothetical protein
MQEVITYSLTTLEALKQVMPPEDLATYPPLRVANPLSADHEYRRPVLRASLLKVLAENARHHEGELALFEAARVYLPEPEGLPQEQEHIVGVVSGWREDRWGHASDEPVDFYDAKGYVEAALRSVGVEATFQEGMVYGLTPGRTADLLVDDRKVGTIGQVHPSAAAAFGIEQDVHLFELHVDELLPVLGEVRTVAVAAIDHRPVHPTLLDLSDADFEIAPGGVANNPAVPDMVDVGLERFWLQYLYATRQIYILSEPVDVTTLPTPVRDHTGREHYRFPGELLLDVAAFGRLWPDRDLGSPPCEPMLHQNFDRYEAVLFEIGFNADTDFNARRSVQRRVLRFAPDGRAILFNTNTSAVDFIYELKTPGGLPEP